MRAAERLEEGERAEAEERLEEVMAVGGGRVGKGVEMVGGVAEGSEVVGGEARRHL